MPKFGSITDLLASLNIQLSNTELTVMLLLIISVLLFGGYYLCWRWRKHSKLTAKHITKPVGNTQESQEYQEYQELYQQCQLYQQRVAVAKPTIAKPTIAKPSIIKPANNAQQQPISSNEKNEKIAEYVSDKRQLNKHTKPDNSGTCARKWPAARANVVSIVAVTPCNNVDEAVDFTAYLANQGTAELALFMLDVYAQDGHQQLDNLLKAIKSKQLAAAQRAISALTLNAQILAAPELLPLCQQWSKLLNGSEIPTSLQKMNTLLKDTRTALNNISAYAETL